jgi:hypothetical protein
MRFRMGRRQYPYRHAAEPSIGLVRRRANQRVVLVRVAIVGKGSALSFLCRYVNQGAWDSN